MPTYLNSIDVAPDGFRHWTVTGYYSTGEERLLSAHSRKANAKLWATGYASAFTAAYSKYDRPLELIVKGRKGVIREKNSFGNDPADIPG